MRLQAAEMKSTEPVRLCRDAERADKFPYEALGVLK